MFAFDMPGWFMIVYFAIVTAAVLSALCCRDQYTFCSKLIQAIRCNGLSRISSFPRNCFYLKGTHAMYKSQKKTSGNPRYVTSPNALKEGRSRVSRQERRKEDREEERRRTKRNTKSRVWEQERHTLGARSHRSCAHVTWEREVPKRTTVANNFCTIRQWSNIKHSRQKYQKLQGHSAGIEAVPTSSCAKIAKAQLWRNLLFPRNTNSSRPRFFPKVFPMGRKKIWILKTVPIQVVTMNPSSKLDHSKWFVSQCRPRVEWKRHRHMKCNVGKHLRRLAISWNGPWNNIINQHPYFAKEIETTLLFPMFANHQHLSADPTSMSRCFFRIRLWFFSAADPFFSVAKGFSASRPSFSCLQFFFRLRQVLSCCRIFFPLRS